MDVTRGSKCFGKGEAVPYTGLGGRGEGEGRRGKVDNKVTHNSDHNSLLECV